MLLSDDRVLAELCERPLLERTECSSAAFAAESFRKLTREHLEQG